MRKSIKIISYNSYYMRLYWSTMWCFYDPTYYIYL